MLRGKKQAFSPLFGHAIWDGCQLEGSAAAIVVASLGIATSTAAVLIWDYSCMYVSSIKLCFPAGSCQLLATARIINYCTRCLLKCWGDLKKAVLFHTVVPSMASVLETELGAKTSAWSSLAYIQM